MSETVSGVRNYNDPYAGDATPRMVNTIGTSTPSAAAAPPTVNNSNNDQTNISTTAENSTLATPSDVTASQESNTTTTPTTGITATIPRPSSMAAQDRVLSASETTLASKPKSVTPSRKQALLQQARSARLEWIRQVPFPFVPQQQQQQQQQPASNSTTRSNTQQQSPLAPLAETHAGRQMPAALQILHDLYGFEDEFTPNNSTMDHHVREYVASLQEAHSLTVPTAEQARQMALQQHDTAQQSTAKTTMNTNNNTTMNDDEAQLLSTYHRFVQHLAHPAAATLVQGMKRFVHTSLAKQQQKDDTDIKQLASLLQSYTTSTFETIRQHELWREDTRTESAVVWNRRAWESLIYGHVREHVERAAITHSSSSEEAWQERLTLLQFVNAQHLEVACLVPYITTTESEPSDDTATTSLSTLLQEPIRALTSVANYHAPYEKLQRILAMYRGINAALTKALNPDTPSTSEPKLPSADDILPTIILTVLAAKPPLHQLSIVEEFCPPEYLRGEAGYAFTNLYGAVQFLLELPLDGTNTTINLTMAPEEFAAGLERSRAAMQAQMDKQAQKQAQAAASTTIGESAMPTYESLMAVPQIPITPNDIRMARERGEVIDGEWVIRFQQSRVEAQNGFVAAVTGDVDEGEASDDEESPAEERKTPAQTATASPLPPGYRRSYNFLSHSAKDVTVHDLPQLLEEYRQMAHATEVLLAERQAQIAKEKKEQLHKDQKDLYDRVKVVDPSLLATDKKAVK